MVTAAREVSSGGLTSRPIVVDYGCFFRTWILTLYKIVRFSSVKLISSYKTNKPFI